MAVELLLRLVGTAGMVAAAWLVPVQDMLHRPPRYSEALVCMLGGFALHMVAGPVGGRKGRR